MKAIYVSVWDGGQEFHSSCEIDLESREVTNVDSVDVDGLEICEEEYILLTDGSTLDYFVLDGELKGEIPIRTITVSGNDYYVSTETAGRVLLDEEGNPRFDGADAIDNRITYYFEDEEFELPDDLLAGAFVKAKGEEFFED